MLLTICDDPYTHGSYAREVIRRTAKLRTFTAHGRYYHASGEQRAVIWRAVSNEKPIIVKNISYFRNYF